MVPVSEEPVDEEPATTSGPVTTLPTAGAGSMERDVVPMNLPLGLHGFLSLAAGLRLCD